MQRFVYIGSKQFNVIEEKEGMLLLERAFGGDAGHRAWVNIADVVDPKKPLEISKVVKLS